MKNCNQLRKNIIFVCCKGDNVEEAIEESGSWYYTGIHIMYVAFFTKKRQDPAPAKNYNLLDSGGLELNPQYLCGMPVFTFILK